MANENFYCGPGIEGESALHLCSESTRQVSSIIRTLGTPHLNHIVPIRGHGPFLNALGVDGNRSLKVRAGVICIDLRLGGAISSGGSGARENVGCGLQKSDDDFSMSFVRSGSIVLIGSRIVGSATAGRGVRIRRTCSPSASSAPGVTASASCSTVVNATPTAKTSMRLALLLR